MGNIKEIANYWEQRAKSWKKKAPVHIGKGVLYNWLMTRAHKKILKEALDYLNPNSILEVGVGTGRLLSTISQSKLKVGADISLNMLKMASGKVRREACLVQADAAHLPFRDRSFDLVYTCTVLLHVPKYMIQGIVFEIERIAKNILVIEAQPTFCENKSPYADGGHLFPHDYPKLFKIPIVFSKKLSTFKHEAFLFKKKGKTYCEVQSSRVMRAHSNSALKLC